MSVLRVLIADDSRVFRTLMSEVLRENGIEVLEAGDGRTALDVALGERPDMLVLDALMPILSGFEVLTKLRERAPGYTPRVAIVTAVYKSRRWESEARQGYAVDEYMEKPLEPEELVAVIRRFFPSA